MIEPIEIIKSAIGNGVFNTFGTLVGSFGGGDIGLIMNIILSSRLNIIPAGYTMVSDIIDFYVWKKKRNE